MISTGTGADAEMVTGMGCGTGCREVEGLFRRL